MSWLENRKRLEERLALQRRRRSCEGERWEPPFETRINGIIRAAVRFSGLHGRGLRNARAIAVHRQTLPCHGLPEALDGLTVLFLSDLHAPALPENLVQAATMLPGLRYDIAILGGDYQCFGKPSEVETMAMMEPLLAAIDAPLGMFAVLGNHDGHAMADALTRRGVRMLVNRHVMIEKDGAELVLVGLDDIHSFWSPEASAALKSLPEGFRVAVIHSPEFADHAAAAGVDLYLAGHTHAGQIALPGGRPILTAMDSHHGLAVGAWRHHGMTGYTSAGLGAGLPRVRFNTRPEIALLTLRRIP